MVYIVSVDKVFINSSTKILESRFYITMMNVPAYGLAMLYLTGITLNYVEDICCASIICYISFCQRLSSATTDMKKIING